MDKRHRNVMTILALGNCTRSLRRFVVKCLGDDTNELVSDVVGEEVTEVHDGSVILTAEPRLLLRLRSRPMSPWSVRTVVHLDITLAYVADGNDCRGGL